jgi:hypothetical protein
MRLGALKEGMEKRPKHERRNEKATCCQEKFSFFFLNE